MIKIKHLVLSGGGHSFFSSYGAFKSASTKYDLSTLSSIHGTSAGSILGAIITLGYDFETLDDYLITRPWHNIFNVELMSEKGMLNESIFDKIMSPLLCGKGLNPNTTLTELYAYSNINLTVYTLDINTFTVDAVSHKTHPELRLTQALYMSSAIPIVFSPVFYNEKCYLDGGIINNYPLGSCIREENIVDETEILGIRNDYICANSAITESMSFVEYVMASIFKLINHLETDRKQPIITHEIRVPISRINVDDIMDTMYSSAKRKELIDLGVSSC